MKQGIVIEVENLTAIIMTKDGEFLSLPADPNWKIGEEVTLTELSVKTNVPNTAIKKSPIFNKRVLIAMVAALLIFIFPFSYTTEASSFITLDINPSMEMEIKENNVINIKALNSDGEKVLSHLKKEKLKGNLYTVTDNIINMAEELGYLKKNSENIIMVGLLDRSNINGEQYEEYIHKKLTEKKLNNEVLVLNATKEEKDLADKIGVSLGKYLLAAKEKGIVNKSNAEKTEIKQVIKKVKEERKNKNTNQEQQLKSNSDKEKSQQKGNNNGLEDQKRNYDKPNKDGKKGNNNNRNNEKPKK